MSCPLDSVFLWTAERQRARDDARATDAQREEEGRASRQQGPGIPGVLLNFNSGGTHDASSA